MHCLSSSAGFALSPSLLVMALSAFFAMSAQAQTPTALSAAAPAAVAAKPSTDRGLAIYKAKCSACHSVEEHRVGPAHAGVLGRRAGKAVGYEYSDALTKSKLVWNASTLNAWLTDPEQVIPGQRMGYRLSLPQERADVVAYLATLSKTASQIKK
jgi:cytochrome c